MLVISMREFSTNFTTSIPEEYFLEPEAVEEDLKRALTFEEFRDRSIEHIHELYRQKGK